MPCVYDESPEEKAKNSKDRAVKLKLDLDKLTKMLCDVLKRIEIKDTQVNDLPKDIQIWWEEHKKLDEKREKETIGNILKRLTEEEVALIRKYGLKLTEYE